MVAALKPGDQLRIHPVSGFEGINTVVTSVSCSSEGTTVELSETANVTAGAGVYLIATKGVNPPKDRPRLTIAPTRPLRAKCPFVERILKPQSHPRRSSVARNKTRLLVKVDSVDWLRKLQDLQIDAIVTQLDLTDAETLLNDRHLMKLRKEALVFEFPPFIPQSDLTSWKSAVQRLHAAGVCRWMCAHVSQKRLCPSEDETIADASIGVLNRFTQKVLYSKGFAKVCFSVEDDFPNMRAIASPRTIAYQFGRIPLFISRIRPALPADTRLTDARGKSFVTARRYGLYYLVSEEPLCLFQVRRKLDERAITNYLIDLSFYPPDETFARSLFEHFYGHQRFAPSTTFNFKTALQ
jgi:putative protease